MRGREEESERKKTGIGGEEGKGTLRMRGEDFERMGEDSEELGTGLGGRRNETLRERKRDFEEGETRTLRRTKQGL